MDTDPVTGSRPTGHRPPPRGPIRLLRRTGMRGRICRGFSVIKIGRHPATRALPQHIDQLAGTDAGNLALSQEWAAAGNYDTAERLARAIGNPFEQALALVFLASTAADAGEFDRAERIAHSVADAAGQQKALIHLVRTVAMAGDFARAQQISSSISDRDARDQAMAVVMKAATDAGDFASAEEVFQRTRNTGERDTLDALADLIRAMVKAGDIDDAERLVRAVEVPGRPDHLLLTLASEVATAGHLVRATRIALDLGEPNREAMMRFIQRVSDSREQGAELVQPMATEGDKQTGRVRTRPSWYEFAPQAESLSRNRPDRGRPGTPENLTDHGRPSQIDPPVVAADRRTGIGEEQDAAVPSVRDRKPRSSRRKAFFDGLSACFSFGAAMGRTEMKDRSLLRQAIRNVASVSRTLGGGR